MNQWNNAFQTRGRVFHEPQEDVPGVAKLFEKNGVRRLLDLGCGSGRHTVFLAKKGFEVYGIDNAAAGLKLTEDWLRQEGLQANLKLGSIYEPLPYADNFFDALISIQVINHGNIESIRKLIAEIQRILRPNGLVFLTTRRIKRSNWQIDNVKRDRFLSSNGKEMLKMDFKVVGPRTYMPVMGGEVGLIHYDFDRKTLKKEFKGFDIKSISVSSNKRHYCLLGELKTRQKAGGPKI